MGKVLKNQQVASVRNLHSENTNLSLTKQNNRSRDQLANLSTEGVASPTTQTSEERAVKVREFVSRAREEGFDKVDPLLVGLVPSNIDFKIFRRNLGSLLYQDRMKEERKKIMADAIEK